jgi:2-polyprenyl-3-methyl-5-hydroxy-6-metoxy-1,4-benzoquinol methylase
LAKACLETVNFHPTLKRYETAIDLGSSCGSLLLEMTKRQPDLQVRGMDISPFAEKHWCVPKENGNFVQANFNKNCSQLADKKFDLITCTEVAEHLEHEEYLFDFVDLISQPHSIFVFSAAHPKQQARGHINCHWHGYWRQELEDRGWLYNHQMTAYFCHELGRANHRRKERVPLYYLNAMVFQMQDDPQSEDGLLH